MKKLKIVFGRTCPVKGDLFLLKTKVREAVLTTLGEEHFPYDAEVSVTFCDAPYIHKLNKKYRGVDRPTDVLSFPMYEDGDFDPDECRDVAELGDIVLNLDRAEEQAAEIGHSLLDEVQFLTVHSTLHLLGYDHERSQKDDSAQCAKQRIIVKMLREKEKKEAEENA